MFCGLFDPCKRICVHSVLSCGLCFSPRQLLLASQTGTFPFSFMDIGSLEVGHAWLASELGEAGFDSKLEEALERLVHVTLVCVRWTACLRM